MQVLVEVQELPARIHLHHHGPGQVAAHARRRAAVGAHRRQRVQPQVPRLRRLLRPVPDERLRARLRLPGLARHRRRPHRLAVRGGASEPEHLLSEPEHTFQPPEVQLLPAQRALSSCGRYNSKKQLVNGWAGLCLQMNLNLSHATVASERCAAPTTSLQTPLPSPPHPPLPHTHSPPPDPGRLPVRYHAIGDVDPSITTAQGAGCLDILECGRAAAQVTPAPPHHTSPPRLPTCQPPDLHLLVRRRRTRARRGSCATRASPRGRAAAAAACGAGAQPDNAPPARLLFTPCAHTFPRTPALHAISSRSSPRRPTAATRPTRAPTRTPRPSPSTRSACRRSGRRDRQRRCRYTPEKPTRIRSRSHHMAH